MLRAVAQQSSSSAISTEFTSSGNFTMGGATNAVRVILIGAGGGGGTGTSSLLGGDGGGGSSGGSGTTGNDNNSSDSSGTGGAAGSGAQDWRTSLPKDMQENVSLKKYTSVEALAGAYINAQKLIGGDKIPVPTSHTTPEEWNGIFRKLGVPEKKEDYKVSFGEKPPVGDTFANAFVDQAYKLGIIPAQAQKLADWFNSETATQSQKAVTIVTGKQIGRAHV